MAISDAVQTLTAAFSFGIVLEALCAGLFIHLRGHASKILQDGQRLVLVLFLSFAALWVQVEFANLMLPTGSSMACRGTLIASTIFDQLSRVAMVQFLFWAIGRCGMLTIEKYLMPVVVVARLGLGLGMTFTVREDFAPTCVAQTSILAPSIAVISLDAGIICWFIARTLSMGLFSDLQAKNSSSRQEQSRAVILCIAGFTVWTGTSVAMILGIPGILLILRTTLPSIGLLVLVAILIAFPHAISASRAEQMTTPEAQSPFISSTDLTRDIMRETVASGTPKSGSMYAKTGPLFVVNQTPIDSPTNFQINRDSDTRGFKKLGDMPPIQITGASGQAQAPFRPAPPRRGSSGVFGSIVGAPLINSTQRSLAPPILPGSANRTREAVPTVAVSRTPQKKNFFGWSNSPARVPIRTLGISMPIMVETEGDDERLFAKIPTVDLATAARNETERRRATIERSRPNEAKPMPPPPSSSPEEGLRNSISTKRKIPSTAVRTPLPPVPASVSSSMLVARSEATSSSASLSPGHEELRRRSPRNFDSFDGLGEGNPIQRPVMQRKPTVGLPSNPRSQRQLVKEQSWVPEQPAPYVNNVVTYEDTDMVKTIIQDAIASDITSQKPTTAGTISPASYTTNFQTSSPIIHRPRPYRKDSETDRALFPSEPSPYHKRSKSGSKLLDASPPTTLPHKRSKSGSAILNRKSIFGAPVGSPTNLPPLPLVPRSAKDLKRLLPSSAKSMTFDEKIELLFPAPPQSTLNYKRRSSVPSLPRVPSIFMSDSNAIQGTTEGDSRSRRTSKRSTIASLAMAVEASHRISSPKSMALKSADRQTLHSSLVGDFLEEIKWLPRKSQPNESSQSLPLEEANLAPLNELQFQMRASVAMSEGSEQDDATTYWGSVHSEAPLVDMKTARQNAHSTYIQQRAEQEQQVESPVPQISAVTSQSHGIIPILFDTNSEEAKSMPPPMAEVNRRSFLLDEGEVLPIDKPFTPVTAPAWHRRIGDQLPTFSERDTKTRTRKMPPPTPLLLSKMGRNATLIVHAAEPSPIESPEKTIEEIKAQLQLFEEPSRNSLGSLFQDADRRQTQIEDRMRYLESLEEEMGQQEDQWQQMQTNLDRDSISTTSTLRSPPAPPPKDATFNRRSSQNGSKRLSRIATRQARFRNSVAQMYRGEDSTSSQSSDTSRASVWQQRLAEAQVEYLENAPALLGKSLNFLAISNMQLGSPTPPESLDSETSIDTEPESDSDNDSVEIAGALRVSEFDGCSLWEPSPPSPKAAAGRLWNHPYETSNRKRRSVKPAAIMLRPAQRKVIQPLQITSYALWSKPDSSAPRRSAFGLWRCQGPRPKSIVVKRASQKPKRQTRRLTYLPDIVESPLPLPNKTDTLGVFQFAWGEVSDQPVYQPNFLPGFIPVSSVNSQVALKSQHQEPEGSEYSSSFFDDYDDEESGDEEANYDSEDEFDDSTLTEIADLLKSTDVPSRESMFSPWKVESYYDGDSNIENDVIADELFERAPEIPVRLPILPLAVQIKAQPAAEEVIIQLVSPEQTPEESLFIEPSDQTPLWTIPPKRTVSQKGGLFSVDNEQPSVRGTANSPAAIDISRSVKVNTAAIPQLTSQDLWRSNERYTETTNWLTASTIKPNGSDAVESRLLWTPPAKKLAESNTMLFDISARMAASRTTPAAPAALGMIHKPSLSQVPLSRLTTSELWTAPRSRTIEHDWISESSVRPSSPSICSSPASDVSSADVSDASSVHSGSTKASSFWGSVSSSARAHVPAWWESRSLRTIAQPKSVDNDTLTSLQKDPVEAPKSDSKFSWLNRQKPKETLSSVRASRDFWEANTQTANQAPTLRPRKSSVAKVPSLLPNQPRREFRSIVASEVDWDTALADAIIAGQPPKGQTGRAATKEELDTALASAIKQSKKQLTRYVATPEEWDAALSLAMCQSNQQLQPTHASSDILKSAPEHSTSLWSASVKPESLSQGLLWARGDTPAQKVISETFSVSPAKSKKPVPAENPEFSVLQSSTLWQPTQPFVADRNWLSQKITARQTITQTWVPAKVSMRSQPIETTEMWSKPTNAAPAVTGNLFSHIKADALKKSTRSTAGALPSLNSTQLFKATVPVTEGTTNWLHSMPSMPSMPSHPEVASTSSLWSPSHKKSSTQSADMFSDDNGDIVKKSKRSLPADLPRLNSNQLFEPTTKPEEHGTHWLAETSSGFVSSPIQENFSKSFPISASATWRPSPTPSVTSSNSQSGLWTSQPVPLVPSAQDAFSQAAQAKEPWVHKKRTLEGNVQDMQIVSTGLWTESKPKGPISPKNWLKKAKISRVQFRY